MPNMKNIPVCLEGKLLEQSFIRMSCNHSANTLKNHILGVQIFVLAYECGGKQIFLQNFKIISKTTKS